MRTGPLLTTLALVALTSAGCARRAPPALSFAQLITPEAASGGELVLSPGWAYALRRRGDEAPPALLDLRRHRVVAELRLPGAPAEVLFSPDGRLLLVTTAGELGPPRRRPRVLVFRSDDGERLLSEPTGRLRRRRDPRRPDHQGGRFYSTPRALFSASGRHLLIGPRGPRRGCAYPFELFDLERWTRLSTFCGVSGSADALAIDGRGQRLAAGAALHLRLIDRDHPRQPTTIRGVESVIGLELSPDGRWLAAETWEGLRLVHLETGEIHDGCDLRPQSSRASPGALELVASPRLGHHVARLVMAFDPSGRHLAVAGEHLCWFTLEGDQARLERRRLAFPAQALALSAEGDELALVERFVDGYVLELIDTASWQRRYSAAAALIDPGAPFRDERLGWRACAMACPEGLQLRCGPVDEAPLLSGGCELECRGERRPERRCLTPRASSLVPALRRLLSRDDEVLRRRATTHLRRLAPDHERAH